MVTGPAPRRGFRFPPESRIVYAAGCLGLVADTVRHAGQTLGDITGRSLEDSLMIYGFPTGIETSLLGFAPRVVSGITRNVVRGINAAGSRHRRYDEITRRILPGISYVGAVANGLRQYIDPDSYETFLPVIGNIDAYRELPNYAQMVVDGGATGAGVVLVPWLVIQGARSGLYDSVAKNTGKAFQWTGKRYVDANRGLFNFVNGRFSALHGNTAGRIAGAGAVLGANGTALGALYGVGSISGIL